MQSPWAGPCQGGSRAGAAPARRLVPLSRKRVPHPAAACLQPAMGCLCSTALPAPIPLDAHALQPPCLQGSHFLCARSRPRLFDMCEGRQKLLGSTSCSSHMVRKLLPACPRLSQEVGCHPVATVCDVQLSLAVHLHKSQLLFAQQARHSLGYSTLTW